jgi:hypothetical protein
MSINKKQLYPFYLLFFCIIVYQLNAQSDSLSPYAQKVISTSKDVETKNKLVGKLDPNAMPSLPIGIVKEIGSTKYIIAIDSGVFKPNGAFFNAYMAIELPGSTVPLAFAAKNVWFNPKGVGTGPLTRLVLVSEYHIRISNNITLRFKPDGTNFVEWDCNGFKSVSLKGYFEFAPGMLLPDSTATHDKIVTASFQLITNDIHDFVVDVSITPFYINGLKDFSFSVKDAVVDLSELSNVKGMLFPKGYVNTGGANPSLWTGFYIRQLNIKLPPELSKSGKRVEVSASEFLIDKTGVSGNISVSNLFSLSEGDMGGWPFSIDQCFVNFISNQVNGATISGLVQLPFMNGSALNYTAGMYQNHTTNEIDYSFIIKPKSNISVPAFLANITVYNTSVFSTIKTNGKFIPCAILNGDIKINSTNLNLPAIKFEKLLVTSEKPYIKGGLFALSDAVGASIGGFSCSIDSIRVLLNSQHPELDVTGTINFMDKSDHGFSASTSARIIAKVEEVPIKTDNPENTNPSTKTNWSLDRITVGNIGLNIQTQPYRIKGGIVYKENDPVYGKGFFGSLSFEMQVEPANFNLSVNAGFGSTTALRYWYVDGIVSTAIPLGTVAEIKRLMGGMYYHMRPKTSFTDMPALLYKNSKSFTLPINYVPDIAAGYGFRAGITFSALKSEKVFNGDLLLTVNLNNNGGLSNVALDGNVVSLTSISDRLNQPATSQKIYGNMHLVYDNANQSFHALLQANINVPHMVSGSGQAVIHFDPKEWYVCIGKPSRPLNVVVLNVLSTQAYFMMGHNLEPMPPPPSMVTSIVNGYGLNNSRNTESLKSGNGVAVGMNFLTGISDNFGNDAVNVNYSLSAIIGFDVMATDYGSTAKCSNTGTIIGINGWYCQGQAYLGLRGAFRAHVDVDCGIFSIKDDFNLFTLSAGAILQAQAPKPTYFKGDFGLKVVVLDLFSTNYNVSFSTGTPCASVIN